MNKKFLTESARIASAYAQMINENYFTDKVKEVGSKIKSGVNSVGKSTDGLITNVFNAGYQGGENLKKLLGNTKDDRIATRDDIKKSIENTQPLGKIQKPYNRKLNALGEPIFPENAEAENDNTEFTGDEEDYINDRTAIVKKPETLTNDMTKEELQKKYYPENESVEDGHEVADDNALREAIVDVSKIAEENGAKLGQNYSMRDDYAVLRLVITDPNKEPGVGFDMNYIMGVGYSIESEMKKAGINGFVGATGYTGCATTVFINAKKPYSE